MTVRKHSYREQDRRDAIRLALQKAKGQPVSIPDKRMKAEVERHVVLFKSLKKGRLFQSEYMI